MPPYGVAHIYLGPVFRTHSEDIVNQPQHVAQRDVPPILLPVRQLFHFLAAKGDERR